MSPEVIHNIWTGVALVIIFGLLVMFHELGHFSMARLFRVRVEEFAFGFGPKKLKLFKLGDTEYTIHPFPLGGFVKLAGMEPGQEYVEDGFQAQAAWKRAIIIFAGPFASFVLAALIFTFVGLYWGFPHSSKIENKIALVSPKTVAQQIDLRAGDRILEINGEKIENGNEMISLIHESPGKKLDLTIERKGQIIEKIAVPSYRVQYAGAMWSTMKSESPVVTTAYAKDTTLKSEDRLIVIDGNEITSGKAMVQAVEKAGPKEVELMVKRDKKTKKISVLPEVVSFDFLGCEWRFPGAYAYGTESKLSPESAAAKAGIKKFDVIKKINGKEIKSGKEAIELLKKNNESDIKLELMREDETVTINIDKAAFGEGPGNVAYYDADGLLGFMPAPVLERASFSESVVQGLGNTVQLFGLVIHSLKPENVGDAIGGPIMIASSTSTMLSAGVSYVVHMAGALSMSLAIINLLPIPVVDGGHLMIMAIEGIRRKRLTPEQHSVATMIGLAILATIVILVLYSDISKLIQGSVFQ